MLLGLCSIRPQVGKSTVANYLVEKFSFSSVEMSWPIEIFAKKYFGYTGKKSKDIPYTTDDVIHQRRILQEIGLMAKTLCPDYWLYHTLYTIDEQNSLSPIKSLDIIDFETLCKFKKDLKENLSFASKNIVISGIRSVLEAEELMSLGGKTILIERSGTQLNINHKVEFELAGWDNFSYKIDNDSSIIKLYIKIDEIMKGEMK